jgi:HSP20 family protein
LATRRFSDLMDDFFSDAIDANNNSFIPNIDISETDKQFLITAELPGMKKEDINLNIENGGLTIHGERKSEQEEKGKTFHRIETKRGSFNRSFQLPDYVDEDTIDASYDDGVLNISMDKAENKVKKQIEVK